MKNREYLKIVYYLYNNTNLPLNDIFVISEDILDLGLSKDEALALAKEFEK